MALFGTVAVVLYNIRHVHQFNTWVALVGLGITSASIALFLPNVDVVDQRDPFGGFISLVEGGVTPRIIGLARDPNFFGFTALFSLFTLVFAAKLPWQIRWIGTAILLTAIFFSGSRMLAGSFAVGTLSLAVLLMISRRPELLRQMLLNMVPGAVIAVVLLPLWFQIPVADSNLGSVMFQRYGLRLETPRTELWAATIEEINSTGATSPVEGSTFDQTGRWIIGSGLRSNQIALDGKYSHNSYLDLLGETGLVGLLLWVAMTAAVTFRGIKELRRGSAVAPWVALWVSALVFMFGFSLLAAPYYWFIAAVIAGLALRPSFPSENPLTPR